MSLNKLLLVYIYIHVHTHIQNTIHTDIQIHIYTCTLIQYANIHTYNTNTQYKHSFTHIHTQIHMHTHTYTLSYIWWNITNIPQKTFDVLFFTKVLNYAVASFLGSHSKSKLLKSFILREICWNSIHLSPHLTVSFNRACQEHCF